jgi:predicted transcriptional regulator
VKPPFSKPSQHVEVGSTDQYTLTREQIEDVKVAIAEAERGEFATDDDVARVWAKFGLKL